MSDRRSRGLRHSANHSESEEKAGKMKRRRRQRRCSDNVIAKSMFPELEQGPPRCSTPGIDTRPRSSQSMVVAHLDQKGRKRRSGSVERVKTEARNELARIVAEEDAQIEVVFRFNSDPKRNIGVLCEFYGKEPTPENIVEVIKTTPGLLGDKIGEYFVRPGNEHILRAYFDSFDLRVDFLEAMRRSLSGPFFMPGEAQQIQRTVNALCDSYIAQNPQVFGNQDDPYVLAFALIMLNTDMLKTNVTKKMTEKQFIDNTLRAMQATELSPELLSEMYKSLKARPLQFSSTFKEEFMAMSAPTMRGYLKKKSNHRGATETKHYFVLANSCLYYFKDNSEQNRDKPLGMLQLTEVDVEEHPKSREKFSIVSRGEAISYVKFKKVPEIVPNVKRIKLVAPDAETGEKWCYRLKKSAIMSLFISPDVSEVPDLNDESEEVPYESGAESPVTSAMNSEDFGIENEDSGSSVLVPYNEDDNEYVSPSAFGPSPLAEGLSE